MDVMFSVTTRKGFQPGSNKRLARSALGLWLISCNVKTVAETEGQNSNLGNSGSDPASAMSSLEASQEPTIFILSIPWG